MTPERIGETLYKFRFGCAGLATLVGLGFCGGATALVLNDRLNPRQPERKPTIVPTRGYPTPTNSVPIFTSEPYMFAPTPIATIEAERPLGGLEVFQIQQGDTIWKYVEQMILKYPQGGWYRYYNSRTGDTTVYLTQAQVLNINSIVPGDRLEFHYVK